MTDQSVIFSGFWRICDPQDATPDYNAFGIHMLRHLFVSGRNPEFRRCCGAAVLFAFSLLVLTGCSGSVAAPKAAPKPVSVVVATPTVEMVTEHEEFTGRTIAVETVEMRARVSGYLEKVLFKDGEVVKAGQPLFEIDARPYQAEVERTKATVDQLQARPPPS